MSELALYFNHHPIALIAVAGLLGLVVGSFLNVVSYRLPLMMFREWRIQAREYLELDPNDESKDDNDALNLAFPASHCPNCKEDIWARDNIPLFGWIFLRGKCRHCGARISVRYPIVECLTAIFSMVVVFYFGFNIEALAALVLTWSLIALSLIDIDHQILPDQITLSLLWLGLLLSLFSFEAFSTPTEAIVGAIAGYLSLWTIYMIFKIITGKEGMGFGDFKLFAALGAWLGWQSLPLIILLSSLVGAAFGISLIVFRGADRQLAIPFGPYLAAAGWIALIWGENIIQAYLGTPLLH
ncbi:MAG TPA: prepilin peptidase [Gammaproteobacteria bacterium]|nr:prepilin peptidase [Gammaproteobacteria bacterium]